MKPLPATHADTLFIRRARTARLAVERFGRQLELPTGRGGPPADLQVMMRCKRTQSSKRRTHTNRGGEKAHAGASAGQL